MSDSGDNGACSSPPSTDNACFTVAQMSTLNKTFEKKPACVCLGMSVLTGAQRAHGDMGTCRGLITELKDKGDRTSGREGTLVIVSLKQFFHRVGKGRGTDNFVQEARVGDCFSSVSQVT